LCSNEDAYIDQSFSCVTLLFAIVISWWRGWIKHWVHGTLCWWSKLTPLTSNIGKYQNKQQPPMNWVCYAYLYDFSYLHVIQFNSLLAETSGTPAFLLRLHFSGH